MLQGIEQGFYGERVTVVNLVPIDYIIQAAASLALYKRVQEKARTFSSL